MKVIDMMREAMSILGLDEAIDVLNSATETYWQGALSDPSVAKVFSCTKFAVQELCTNYCPILTEREFSTINKKFAVSEFENFIRMQKVLKDGEEVPYKLINRQITLDEDGNYTARYLSYVYIGSLYDDLDFLSQFSPDVLIFAICSYYTLANGMFTQFEDFHEIYVQKAESLREIRSTQMPMRRWE